MERPDCAKYRGSMITCTNTSSRSVQTWKILDDRGTIRPNMKLPMMASMPNMEVTHALAYMHMIRKVISVFAIC